MDELELLPREAIGVCSYCGREFVYDTSAHRKPLYCSVKCSRDAEYQQRQRNGAGPFKRTRDSTRSPKFLVRFLLTYKWKCAICGWRGSGITFSDKGVLRTAGNEIHHIVPVCDGGESTWDNLILLCPNHHREAHLGTIPQGELRKYVRPELAESERAALMNRVVLELQRRNAWALGLKVEGAPPQKEDEWLAWNEDLEMWLLTKKGGPDTDTDTDTSTDIFRRGLSNVFSLEKVGGRIPGLEEVEELT